jgi:hypothetical protein
MIERSNILVTTSEYLKQELIQNFQKNTFSIMNGYDPEEFNYNKWKYNMKEISMIYAGNLYNGKRDPENIFSFIKSYNNKNTNKVYLNIYSNPEKWLVEKVNKYELNKYVSINNKISRSELLKKEKNSDILLILLWDNEDDCKIIPGKLFEYISLNRPILGYGPKNSEVERIINSTNTGLYVSDIKELISNFSKIISEANYKPNNIDYYSQIRMAKEYSQVLNLLV